MKAAWAILWGIGNVCAFMAGVATVIVAGIILISLVMGSLL